MIFTVLTTPSFEKRCKKLIKKDRTVQKILEGCIDVLSKDPFNKSRQHSIKKLVGVKEGEGCLRIRFGRYRIRYDIDKKFVVLHSIRERKDAYR